MCRNKSFLSCLPLSHAHSVTLVLSLTCGLVSPQFHVVYDDHFATVHDALVPKPLDYDTQGQ